MIFAIYSNPHNDPGMSRAYQAADTLMKAGVTVRVEAQCRDQLPAGALCCETDDLCRGADLMVVLGGDGTLLSAAQMTVQAGIPMLGINLGRKGFLSEVELEDMDTWLLEAAHGKYSIEKRLVLKAQVRARNGELRYEGYALNDFYILSKAPSHRMITMETLVSGTSAGKYAADGLLVASPTGSTGYSLSAGGPVVSPGMQCMTITPICAHMLRARPIVVGGEETIVLRPVEERGSAMLHGDGRELCEIAQDDEIIVTRYEKDAMFARFGNRNFFSLLREKLSEWRL